MPKTQTHDRTTENNIVKSGGGVRAGGRGRGVALLLGCGAVRATGGSSAGARLVESFHTRTSARTIFWAMAIQRRLCTCKIICGHCGRDTAQCAFLC